MIPYYIIFFFAVFFSLFSKTKYKSCFKFFTYLILIILISLRSIDVGTDTYNYYDIFNNVGIGNVFNYSIEPLFLLLNFFSKTIYNDFSFYLFFISSIFFFIWNMVFKKFSLDYTVTIVFFISFFCYLSFFNIERQSLAFSICTLSLYYLFNKKYLKYVLLVFLASMIHYSALIFFVTFFVFRFFKNPLFILVGSFFVTYLLGNYFVIFLIDLDFKNSYLSYDQKLNSISGFYLILFVILQYILFYIMSFFIKDNYSFNNLFKIFSIGVGSFLACKVLMLLDDGPIRLTYYFLVVNVFLFSISIGWIKDIKIKFIIKFLFILFCFVYFNNVISSGYGGLNPYIFDEKFRYF